MLRVVTWKWAPQVRYRSLFEAVHVNTLANMVERHYRKPYEFVCITDDWKNLHSSIRVIPLWKDLGYVKSTHGDHSPSCFRRLRAFSPEAKGLIGDRFVSLDLDCVVTADMSPVWDRGGEFIIWGDDSRTTPYNGSMWLLQAGTRTQVWDKFDPETSPLEARQKGYHGSDQAWLSYILPGEKRWTQHDGVYSYRVHIRQNGWNLPADSRIVFFNGHVDPWSPAARRNCPWILQHYY